MVESLEDWKLVVGIVATVVGGLWTVFVYFDRRRAPTDPAATPRPSGRHAVAPQGVAAAGDLRAERISVSALPIGAVIVMLAGLALVAWTVFAAGGRVSSVEATAECGAAAGGDIVGSRIETSCVRE